MKNQIENMLPSFIKISLLILFFILPFVIFRTHAAFQEANELPPFLQIYGVHIHHYQIAFIFLPILFIILIIRLQKSRKPNGIVFFILILISFTLGTFIDGLIPYY